MPFGSDILKKPEALYELAVLTSILVRNTNIPLDKVDAVANEFAARITKLDTQFVAAQKQVSPGRASKETTAAQPQSNALPRRKEGWIEEVKKDAKVSSLIAILGALDMIKAG